MLFGLFLTLGVAVLSVALRSYQTSLAQKLGALGILIASFLAVYFITGNAGWGVAGAATWLFLPWLEILTRIRTLRLPKEKRLRPKSPPSTNLFPALDEISREIENEGFAHVNDAGWDWEDYRQFFRLFYKTDDCAQCPGRGAQTRGEGRSKVFLARDDLSLVPVLNRFSQIVTLPFPLPLNLRSEERRGRLGGKGRGSHFHDLGFFAREMIVD